MRESDVVFNIKPNKGSRTFRKYRIDGKDYIGVHGNESYVLSVKNNSGTRMAVRLTIDGTDIITGKPADLAYGSAWIVNPYDTCELEAWPESNTSGGRFVFAQAEKSAAAHTHGVTSHLGILAAAIWVETAERLPRFDSSELHSRHSFGGGGGYRGGDMMKGGGGYAQTLGFGPEGSMGDSPLRSMGPGTGVGSQVEQRIGKAKGLDKPRLERVMQVHYLWWDDLQALIRKGEAPTSTFVPGFPDAAPETFPGIDLSGVPRIETDDPRFTVG